MNYPDFSNSLPFSQNFLQTKGKPFLYHGSVVSLNYEADVQPDTKLAIELIRADEPPFHCLCFACTKCMAKILNKTAKQGVLASCSLREGTVLTFVNVHNDAEIVFWNAVSDEEYGRPIYGLGNYGIVIQSVDSNVDLLHCSFGIYPRMPDFDSFVVSICNNVLST